MCARICLMQDAGAATTGMLVWTETWATSTPPPRRPSPKVRGDSRSVPLPWSLGRAESAIRARQAPWLGRHQAQAQPGAALVGASGWQPTALDWCSGPEATLTCMHPAAATSMGNRQAPSFTLTLLQSPRPLRPQLTQHSTRTPSNHARVPG